MAQAAGHAAAAAGEREPELEAAPVSASALLHAVQAGIADDRPVVLVLDDVDEAPALEWHSLFLDRWIAPLVRDHQLLVVLSAHAGTPGDGALDGSVPINARASTVRIGPLGSDDVVESGRPSRRYCWISRRYTR